MDLLEEARRSLEEPESARPNLVSHDEETDPRKKYLFILNGNQRRNRRSNWGSTIRVIQLILQPVINRVLCLIRMSLPITIEWEIIRHLVVTLFTLGAKGGVPGWYTTNTLQGHGQSTHPYTGLGTGGAFIIFQANFFAVFLIQEMLSTFTVSQVM